MIIIAATLLIGTAALVAKLVYDVQVAKKQKRSGSIYADDLNIDKLD